MGGNEGLRAFLQRGEVRLSTMHRIAGAFLSGAGLLLLIPAVLFGTLTKIIDAAQTGDTRYALILWTSLAFFILFPLYALILLMRDLVRFYFTPNPPGATARHFYSRFILSGITFSEDENEAVKRTMEEEAIKQSWITWVIPDKSDEQLYFSEIMTATSNTFIEDFRTDTLTDLSGDDARRAKLLYVGYRLAGTEDRTLYQEATKMELSLIRHSLALRHLVLRYIKSFGLVVLTAVVSAIMANAEALKAAINAPKNAVIVGAMLILWGALCPIVVRAPILWIQAQRNVLAELPLIQDRQLNWFERQAVLVSQGVLLLAFFHVGFELNAAEPYFVIGGLLILFYWMLWRRFSFSRKLPSSYDSWSEWFKRLVFGKEMKRARSTAGILLQFVLATMLYFALPLSMMPMLRPMMPGIGDLGLFVICVIPAAIFSMLILPKVAGTIERVVTKLISLVRRQ